MKHKGVEREVRLGRVGVSFTTVKSMGGDVF